MGVKHIKEIGSLINVKYKFFGFTQLTADEILQTTEYKIFKKKYPLICKACEEF